MRNDEFASPEQFDDITAWMYHIILSNADDENGTVIDEISKTLTLTELNAVLEKHNIPTEEPRIEDLKKALKGELTYNEREALLETYGVDLAVVI